MRHASVFFSVHQDFPVHPEIERFVKPKGRVAEMIRFNEDLSGTPGLQALQACRKRHPSQGVFSEILVTSQRFDASIQCIFVEPANTKSNQAPVG